MDKSEKEILWNGNQLCEKTLLSESGVNQVLPLRELQSFLASNLKTDTLLAIDEEQFREGAFYDPEMREQLAHFSGIKRRVPLFPLLGEIPPMRACFRTYDSSDQLRWVKSEDELNLIRRSCDIGSAMITSAMRQAIAMSNESQFVGLLEFEVGPIGFFAFATCSCI